MMADLQCSRFQKDYWSTRQSCYQQGSVGGPGDRLDEILQAEGDIHVALGRGRGAHVKGGFSMGIVRGSSSQAATESGLECFPVQVASDEHNLALTLFIRLPGAISLTLEEHMDTLKYKPVGAVA